MHIFILNARDQQIIRLADLEKAKKHEKNV